MIGTVILIILVIILIVSVIIFWYQIRNAPYGWFDKNGSLHLDKKQKYSDPENREIK